MPVPTRDDLEALLGRLPDMTVAVVGDFCLDVYMTVDTSLEQPSPETGLPAHQVVARRHSPGGAANVAAGLASVGFGRVLALGLVGDDGHGWELRGDLEDLGVDTSGLPACPGRMTSAYIKTFLRTGGGGDAETDRHDIMPREDTPTELQQAMTRSLEQALDDLDAVVVVDQVPDESAGTVTPTVREAICRLGHLRPTLPVLVDSRFFPGRWRDVELKPNIHEAFGALDETEPEDPARDRFSQVIRAASVLHQRCGKPVYLTVEQHGIVVADGPEPVHVPTARAHPPIDISGCGDSAAVGIAAARACGWSPVEAAHLGNAVAGITIHKIATTGTATPQELLQRWTAAAKG